MPKTNAQKQRDFIERKKSGDAPERRLSLWVPVAEFDAFTRLAITHGGRANAFTRLIETEKARYDQTA